MDIIWLPLPGDESIQIRYSADLSSLPTGLADPRFNRYFQNILHELRQAHPGRRFDLGYDPAVGGRWTLWSDLEGLDGEEVKAVAARVFAEGVYRL